MKEKIKFTYHLLNKVPISIHKSIYELNTMCKK